MVALVPPQTPLAPLRHCNEVSAPLKLLNGQSYTKHLLPAQLFFFGTLLCRTWVVCRACTKLTRYRRSLSPPCDERLPSGHHPLISLRLSFPACPGSLTRAGHESTGLMCYKCTTCTFIPCALCSSRIMTACPKMHCKQQCFTFTRSFVHISRFRCSLCCCATPIEQKLKSASWDSRFGKGYRICAKLFKHSCNTLLKQLTSPS